MIGRNDPCWCGSGKKFKKCCSPNVPAELDYKTRFGILLKTPKEIEKIRNACRVTADILEATCAMAKEGITTDELNTFAHKLHVKAKATPAALHYGSPPYPKSICLSLNEVICHGIADDRPLQSGDILNIDVASIVDGFYGDCSAMVMIGEVSDESKRVVEVAHDSLMKAIAVLGPGVPLNEVGNTIDAYATGMGCSVVRDFVGHGVGVDFHEPPQVLHCKNAFNVPLAPGMTFTIEPMINAGVVDGYIDPDDGWTVRTVDGKPSAQWEHTVLITAEGSEILTAGTAFLAH